MTRAPHLSRRRVLMLAAAAFAGAAGRVAPVRWQGRALGAEVSLTLHAPRAEATAAIETALGLITEVEDEFSLYRDSALTRLNRAGRLRPSPRFRDLLDKADAAHALTGGLFDPTVQPLYDAQVRGQRLPQHLVGWHRVERGRRIVLGQGQALTFNGIAQGYATDLVRAALTERGLTDILVNIGEYAAAGGPWRLGIRDPRHGHVAARVLTSGAIATSSATPTGLAHIFGPEGQLARRSTVSVEADEAWLADALSTAAILADDGRIATMRAAPSVRGMTLVDTDGRVTTL